MISFLIFNSLRYNHTGIVYKCVPGSKLNHTYVSMRIRTEMSIRLIQTSDYIVGFGYSILS